MEECSHLPCPGEQELLLRHQNERAFSLSLNRTFYFASQNGRCGAVAVSVVDTEAESGGKNVKERTSFALAEVKNSWKFASKKSVRVSRGSRQFMCGIRSVCE